MTTVLAILASVSLVIVLWQWIVARRFKLHQRVTKMLPGPPLTILKPLSGYDNETKACLESWLTQKYQGTLQVLFGVSSPSDPVCPIVRELIARHPNVNAQLLICAEILGANVKVSTLVQLERLALNDFVVISDADVRVPQDLLTNLMAGFSDNKFGLINCFYCLANPITPPMRWEAVAVNADFWNQVLQARSIKPLDFALGAVMATSRDWLKKIGGLEALVNFLADDYELGNRISKQNGKIVLCPVVVDCWSAPMNWKQVWRHQLRWARTIRVCQPIPCFLTILGNSTIWPLFWWLYQPSLSITAAFALILFIRGATAMDSYRRFAPAAARTTRWWWVFVKDVLAAVIWVLAFFGNQIEWRGRRYRVRTDGQLVSSETSAVGP